MQLLIAKLKDKYDQQPYLLVLYHALLLTTYFGMFCIREMTFSQHVVKARDVHVATNKPKILFILHTSKTHGKGDKPQMIKLTGSTLQKCDPLCPFSRLIDYIGARKNYIHDAEQFFIFRDQTVVMPTHFRKLLKDLLVRAQLDPSLYGVHGMHAGRSCDLLDMGLSVETIKKLGRWKSTAVYSYLRN